MEEIRTFKKVERSYHSTPNGCRLATFEEAKNGLETIKKQDLLKRSDRARLLDGWISGPGYDYEMGNDFRSCMGYMLLIQTQTPTEFISGFPYDDVNLSDPGKEVALFLCVDDWNYEVVYWLLNCWSKSETMNLGEVRGGNIPFIKATEFVEKNKMLGSVARRLGDEGGAAQEKAGNRNYSGKDSVEDVLSGMIKIAIEEELGIWHFTSFDEYRLSESVQTGDAFWSFVCDTSAGYVVEVCALKSLLDVARMERKRTSEKNLMIATSILLYLSDYRSDIIHEPLAHWCQNSCAGKILSYAERKAVGDANSFNEMLKHNAMWRCYDDTGSYGVLNKLLHIVIESKYEYRVKNAGAVVDVLLKCGAQPAGCYAINDIRKLTALHKAAESYDREVSTEVGQALLGRYDEESRYHFVNTADERGETALHMAARRGNASLCQLLVEFGASVNAQDQEGMTPLHRALEGEKIDKVINVFMKSSHITQTVDLRDKRGRTPLDIAVANKDYGSTAKLLSESKEPEAYLSKVDQEQLLLSSLLLGCVDIVYMLFEKGIRLPAGDCDEDGKTALHLAAMCEDETKALSMFRTIQRKTEVIQKLVAKRDRVGRTALHEAALRGHAEMIEHLLRINPKIISYKDRDGRSPFFDAVKGKCNELYSLRMLFKAYRENDMPEDDFLDRSGQTPLHVAASLGKKEVVEFLLTRHLQTTGKYINKSDSLGKTALHVATSYGDSGTVELLLKEGAHPLEQRDCDRRTALHYAVQAKDGIKLAKLFLEHCASDEERLLLLWASAAGLGTAERNLGSGTPLHEFLAEKKKEIAEKLDIRNLLKMAACLGNIEMTRELITRGYQIGDIDDSEWRNKLKSPEKENVEKVLSQLKKIADQGNDKPTISDNLGRSDYAIGLAALFLNPYLKPPIAVGISGCWGMGKSSLMAQTESTLLQTAAQMALLPSSKFSSSVLELPDIKRFELSREGKEKYEKIQAQINYGRKVSRNIFVILMDKIRSRVTKSSNNRGFQAENEHDREESLEHFLNNYDIMHYKMFKSLAAMDRSALLKTNAPQPNTTQQLKADLSGEQHMPAVLTVQYNAWKYRNDTEALAGMAVEITKELEGIMTHAQWLSTCWRNSWKKKKHAIWIDIIFPCILALVLAFSFTWIAWVMLDSDKLKEWGKVKYAWPPAAIVILVWKLSKPVMGILKPVSTQLMQYVSFPDHTDKLGYQERVISDINFLKGEIGEKPYWVFTAFVCVFNTLALLWRPITGSWVTSLLYYRPRIGNVKEDLKIFPASGNNLRIIVFVDDLDRCQESVILQVLSAINLVLAVCEISVVLGMDKGLIERAIIRKYGCGKANKSLKSSKELANLYLQKIIQLPLDLPEPSEEQSMKFLKVQLGVFEEERHRDSASATDAQNTACDQGDIRLAESSNDQEREAPPAEAPSQNTTAQDVAISVQSPSKTTESSSSGERSASSLTIKVENCLKRLKFPTRPTVRDGVHALQVLWNALLRTEAPSQSTDASTGSKGSSSLSLIKEMLFVTYSQGEQDAFFFFKEFATGYRKLPREWKRLLNYHRLVWYIFFLSNEAKVLSGWQVQLITWLFICWEWEENMNCLIENWNNLDGLKASESNQPSLLLIVDYFIENYVSNKNKMTDTKHEGHHEKEQSSLTRLEDPAIGVDKYIQAAENSNREFETIEEAARDRLARDGAVPFPNQTKKKTKKKKKKKVVMRETSPERNIVKNKANSESIKSPSPDKFESVVKGQLQEFKKEIEVMIEQTMQKNGWKNKKQEKETKDKLLNWERMRYVLYKYDVSMDCIQAFQRFRFYCIAGLLQWPPAKQEYHDEAMISFLSTRNIGRRLNDTP